jgi:hypothetical protein
LRRAIVAVAPPQPYCGIDANRLRATPATF